MKAYHLQANHLSNPIGIDGKQIRLTWKLSGEGFQSAFQVSVRTKKGEKLEDSGKVESDAMHYALSSPLPYRGEYRITVSVWDESGKEGEPAEMTVVTGMEKEQWQAAWISPELSDNAKPGRSGGYLKKTLVLEEEIPAGERAMLYFTARGICNVYINGQEITEMQLMPGTTQEDKRLMVETVEVTEFLHRGENELLVTLGDGWHRGSMGFSQEKNVYGTDISFLAQLEIGEKTVCVTDKRWMASTDGPLRENDMMAGETYDATKEETMTWHAAREEDFGYEPLICVDTVPILPKETFPAKLIVTPKGEQVLDFGQNLVGYVVMDFMAHKGETLTLVHGETLDGEGNFTVENFQNSQVRTEQKVVYTCKEGRNVYHPTKTYFGFRYVKVEGDVEIAPENFTAVAIYSDIRTTAEFSCGVPEVNQLFQNALWSMKGNFVDVPTDCPTREKSGYSGDCQAFVYTAMYLMDCYPVYAKWIREQAATQNEDGCVAQIAPMCARKLGQMDGGIGWCDSFEIVPAQLARRYGDDSLIRENYERISQWIRFQINKSKKPRLTNRRKVPKEYWPYVLDNGWLWGEWLEPGMDTVKYMTRMVMHGDLEISSAYLSYGCALAAEMAERLGRKEDAEYFSRVSEKAREAYRYLFVKEGRIHEESRQCRYVRPIALNMLTEEEKREAAADLAEKIRENHGKLNTGFLTTHELCRALTRYGQGKTAYDLLLQKEAPGWLYAVTKGATTIPENWYAYGGDGTVRDSFNHYSYGAIVGWIFDCVCGIIVENKSIRIQPNPDRRLGHARAVYDSPVGRIVSGWEYQGEKIIYTVEIPANNKAVMVTNQGERVLQPGSYQFEEEENECDT